MNPAVISTASRIATVLLLAGSLSCRPEASLPTFSHVTDFQLVDQDGKPFSNERLDGKIWIADFFFSNCTGPCPRMSGMMRQLQNRWKDTPDVLFVSFTVDPARDNAEALLAYSKRFQAIRGRWFFLTGPASELNRLSREAFLLGEVDASLQHSTRFAVVDRRRRIRGYYRTDESGAIARIEKDLRKLLSEKG